MGGTGSGATVVSLLEYTTSGTLQQTIALPNVTPRPTANPFNLMDAGSSTSHGQMARSSDGTAVVMPGYNGIATDSSIASSSAATVSRTIGVATPDGTVNTSRSYNMLSGNSFRSVASTDGTVFWAAGQPGMVYVNAVGTVASLSTVNTRVANIFNSQLYYSTGSGTVGIYSLGTGLPTSGSPSATLLIGTGSGSQPYGFALNASGTLCYIADDRASAAGGIQKWTSSGGTWTLAYTLGTGAANIGARGLIVDWSGANPVIYATSAETANNRIFRITDTGSGSSATTVASSGTGTVFRGIAFAPVSYTVTYDANGGTGSQTDPSSPYVAGTTVTVLGPGTIARSGYTFAGWNTAADGGGTPYNPSGTFIINANTTLYAQWCQNPTIFTVTGGDFYCSGGSGVEVGLDGSESGVSYQLYRNGGSTPVGSAVPGTGSAISFGNQTVADTYTVVGTRTAGGCSADMASSAVVVVTQDPLTWIHGNGAWNTDDSYWNDASSTAVTYCDGYNVIFGNSGTIDPLLITLDLTVSPASVTMTGDDIEYTIGGLGGIAGAGGLTKAGSRVCTLDTTNTYTGPTTINEGTLALGASGSIADSATISVAGGATFDVSAVSGFSLASGKTLKGNGTVSGTVTVAAGSTLAPGTSIGTIYFDTAPTLAGTTEMEVDKTAGTTDKLVVNTGGGTLTFGGTLSITWLTGSATAGDAYTLFEGASDASPKFSGAFSSITPTTPGTGLSWDTSTLTTDGKLRVTCAPVITSLSVPGACAGGAANLSVSVSGAGLNYAWRKRDASLGWGSGNGWQFAYHSGGCDGWNGVFVDSSTACGQNPGINANGKAFGLYAKSYNSAEAKRNFDTLQVAQTVRFDMQIPVYLEGSGDGNQSQCLVALRNSAAELAPRFEIWVKAGDTVLTVKDGAGETGTTIPYSSHGYRCVFKLTGADTYDLTVTVLATSTDYALAGRTLGGNSGDPINQFRAWFRNYHSDSGDCRNFYVNNLTAGAYTDNADNYTIGACGSTTWTTSPNRGFGPITGATGSTYTINPVATSDAGSYDVVVWNACGQATSSAATLLVSQSGNTVAQVGWTQDSGGPGGAPRAMKTMTSATGLSSAAAPTQTRCEVSATAYDAGNNVIGTIAPLPMASTDLPNGTVKVLFVATKTVHSTEPAYVRVVAKDACNNIGDSDPALTSLQVGNNGIVRQVIEHLHPAEHYLQVANGAPGLHRLELNVNGRSFQLPSLEDGKSLAADIGQAMVEGENNTVILTGHGEAGASAVILVTDRPVSDLVPLTELVVLKLTPAGSSLVLSWPETAVGWRLQASATGVGDWAEVSSVPVAADGQLSVPVQATSGVQFYRLAAPVGRVPINPPPATGATLVVPGSTQPQPTQDSHGAFIF